MEGYTKVFDLGHPMEDFLWRLQSLSLWRFKKNTYLCPFQVQFKKYILGITPTGRLYSQGLGKSIRRGVGDLCPRAGLLTLTK